VSRTLAHRRVISFAIAVILSLGLLGCGTSKYVPYESSIASTQNPLVAQYSVLHYRDGFTAWVEFGTDTNYGRQTSVTNSVNTSGRAVVDVLVAGMLPQTTYHMRAHVESPTGEWVDQDHMFTTGALPALTLPKITVTRPSPPANSPENAGIEMITIASGNTPAFFTDRDGNPIWYYDVGSSSSPYVFKLLPSGHMIVMITTSPISFTAISSIREIDLAGNLIRELDIPTLRQRMQMAGFDFAAENYTHDLVPLDNGHLIVLVNYSKTFTDLPGYPGSLSVVGDGLVDLDENWNPVWAWNSFDHLDVNRHLNGLPDWTHGNGVEYSPSDGNLFLSLRHQSWVLKIDYINGTGTGNVLWRLGYQGDFALTANGVPTDDPSLWFSFQHFPVLVSQSGVQTTLGVWDNGDNRVLNIQGVICGPPPVYNVPCYSRGTIYQIDESAKVANLAWVDLPGLYSLWGGSINQLPNGNVEFDANAPVEGLSAGIASVIQEVTQTSAPQVVWQMVITPGTANAYRAYRFPSLYKGVTWAH
jgi:arylsulfate sulfotransferase